MMERDDLNMKSASLDRILQQIRMQIQFGDTAPIILLGKSGIGKTESIRELSKELRIGFKELRLSHYQESDLIGLPFIDASGHTNHAPSAILPDAADQGQGILLLDEVTASPRSMRSAVYQLLDASRSLGSYRLPVRWLVIACGNGPNDGGDYRGIEPAFMSRGLCWRVEPDLDTWKYWAYTHDIHPAVIAFLSLNPSMLHVMDPNRPYDMIACPRNWTKLSRQMKNLEELSGKEGISRDDMSFSAEGCVGRRCGDAFTEFHMNRQEMILPQEIVSGQVLPQSLAELSDDALYMTIQELTIWFADYLKAHFATGQDTSQDILQKTADVIKWLIGVSQQVRLDAGLAAIYDLRMLCGNQLKSIIMTNAFDQACPEFTAFAQENVELMRNATHD